MLTAFSPSLAAAGIEEAIAAEMGLVVWYVPDGAPPCKELYLTVFRLTALPRVSLSTVRIDRLRIEARELIDFI